MALEEYRRKRDFQKTPEPPPGRVKAASESCRTLSGSTTPRASTMTSVFELDGVLLSWAVTKGPSLKLAIKEPVLTRAETGGLPAREWQSIRWIKPVLLCEVTFTEWTGGRPYPSSFFPGFEGR